MSLERNREFNFASEKSADSNSEKVVNFIKSPIGKFAVGMLVLLVVGGVAAREIFKHKQATEITNTPAQQEQQIQNGTTESTSASIATEVKNDPYAESMEKYKTMSVEIFERLSTDERLQYSQYLIDQTINKGVYESFYGPDSNGSQYTIKPISPSKDSSGQDIINNYQYVRQLSYLQYTSPDNGLTDNTVNVEDGQKILSSAYYNVGYGKLVSNDYMSTKSSIEGLSAPNFLKNNVTAIDTSDLTSKETDRGDKIQYKIVTYDTSNGKRYYARYIFHEYTSYDGSQKSIWLLDVQADSLDALNNQTTAQ